MVGFVNRRDQYHQQTIGVSERFGGYQLLTTDAVLLEIGNALARSHKAESSHIIDEFLHSDDIKIAHLTPMLFNRAFELYKTHQDKEWGLIDCISFVVMHDERITQALTFDRHFIQAGFTILMRGNP